jgi:flavin reductase (DIM6/NTAB) family NADH-FMN oxidoreductase RutF
MVRIEGVEPTRLSALDPKSSVSTSSTISAFIIIYLRIYKTIYIIIQNDYYYIDLLKNTKIKTTMILEIEPTKISTKDLHKYLLASIGPRPIALASTIDSHGINNVSPFSFFNIFSANPPIAIFSPARRVRNNTTKDTLENIKEVKEVVINIVNDEIVDRASISSTEFPREIDEFVESGLTPIASKKIKPFRVYESPVQMECKVNQIIELGQNGGAGNLIVCEIILMHINSSILDENNHIDQNKIKLVGRLGDNWYCKGFDQGLFEIKKPK